MRLAFIRNMIVALSLAGSVACTPLGVWIYEDPEVTVSRVRVGADSLSMAPVLIALALQNPNDYPLSAVHVQLSLELDHQRIGELNRDSDVVLPEGATSTMALPLVLADEVRAGRLRAFRTGTHRFMVMGRAEFTTPLGTRKVRFAQEGDLKFGPPPTRTSVQSDPQG